MAIQIPNSPNIIGSEPVLRSPEQVRGTTITPQFKVDNGPQEDMVRAAGALLANVNQTRVDTYMTQASLWWTENMNKHIREVEDKYKGASAMDLYVREVKPYANKLTDMLFSAPKDDGMVRIANLDLQKQFKKWADGQMRNYNAQIGHYEGQELAKYNESTFDAREQQITEGLMYATTPEEIVGYSQSMLDLNKLRYRGYNPDRISQLAAAKVDAAVVANLKSQITKDVQVGYNYFTDPQVQAALSSKSKLELRQAMREALIKQGEANGGAGLAANDEGPISLYTADTVISQIYGTNNPEEINAVRMEIMGKAQERAKGLREKAAGVQSQINAGLSTELANVTTDEEFGALLEKISEQDPRWAEELDAANQRDAVDRASVYYVMTTHPDYDTEVDKRAGAIIERLNGFYDKTAYTPEALISGGIKSLIAGGPTDAEQAMIATVNEMELAGMSREDAIKAVATDRARSMLSVWESPEQQAALDRYNEYRDRLAKDTETYTAIMNEIVAGTFTGGYDPRVAGLSLSMQRDLGAAVGTEGEYRRLINSHPGVDSVFSSVDATYPDLNIGFKERAKRMAMKRIGDWEKANGDMASGEQLRKLVMQGYADAKDPIYNAMEAAIVSRVPADNLSGENEYWASEARTDYMAALKKAKAVSEAATKAFSASKKFSKSDNTWEEQNEKSVDKIDKFKSYLPENLKRIVDLNKDLYAKWYSYGNTNAIIEHLKQQSGGL